MKKENTAIRLKKIMSDQNLRQVDILNKTIPYCEKYGVKMNKSDISQYCSGKTEPNPDKLFVLGMALNVNEAWLMGFDVPMERDDHEDQNIITFEAKLEEAIKLLEEGGYTASFSEDSKDDIITITNSEHEPVSCMHEYELINKYDSLNQRNTLTAKSLAEIDVSDLKQFDERIRRYAILLSEHFYEKKMLSYFSKLNNENKNKSISYTKNLLSNQQLEEELNLAAAHDRTDIEVTEDMRKHDDDIMMDDSEWE